MNGLMKTLKLSFTGWNKWIAILAIVIVSVLLLNYSNKFTLMDGLTGGDAAAPANADDADEETEGPAEKPAEVNKGSGAAPSDLLPSANNEWDVLNSVGTSTGTNPDLLEAGQHQGIDTISQSLRNANLQIRSDPSIPVVATGPWNQTTIETSNSQVPFNIGS